MTAKSNTSKSNQLTKTYSDEATLLKKVMAYLEPQLRDGVKVIKVRDRYAKGYSDLFICVRGQLVLAELKDDVGEPSPHQIEFIKEMVACGAIGNDTCRTVQDVADLVEEAKRRRPNWPL